MSGRSQKSVLKPSAELGMQGNVHTCPYPQQGGFTPLLGVGGGIPEDGM